MQTPDQSTTFETALAQALALHQSGAIAQALQAYTCLLAMQPAHAHLLYLMGAAYTQLEQFEAGAEKTQASLAINPHNAAAWNNLGYALASLGQPTQALEHYAQAIARAPDYADAHYNQGLAYQSLQQFEAALASYDKAIALNPGHAAAHFNRAAALRKLSRLTQAIASYDQAIAINPQYVEAYNNKGLVFDQRLQLEEALASFDQALAIDPHYVQALWNRGNVLKDLQRLDEALLSFDKAMALTPEDAEVRWNLSLALLLKGDCVKGWPLYESRWAREKNKPLARNFTQPVWLGTQSLEGKTVLLHAEQGLGDSIQFCRYAKRVRDLGATVLLEVPQALMGLFASLEGVSQLIEAGTPLPDFDYHCPLLSLPLAFKTTLSNIPSPQPYLSSQPDKVAAWQQRLGPQTKPRVGLVWRGNPEHHNDHNRSIALADICAHLPQEFAYVSLQKVVPAADLQTLHNRGISHFGAALVDFTDTAALCELMDVVISVDTSVAHLAAAIGRPTWILLPYAPDWRWLLNREDSPWYESVKLYRQGADWRWSNVLSRIAADLRQKMTVAPNQAKTFEALGRLNEALASYTHVLTLNPNDVEAHIRKGVALQLLTRVDEALESYDAALALYPNLTEAHYNKGTAHQALGQLQQALISYDTAISHGPTFTSAHANRGVVLQQLNRLDEALASYKSAIALEPDCVEPHWNMAQAMLQCGDLDNGWKLYEWRWKRQSTPPRGLLQPLWTGEASIKGKTMLLHAEQGLGDSIQFCRYAKLVRDLGATVLLEVPQALMGLFASLEGVSQLIEAGTPLPDFDYHCPLLSLPLAFKTTLSNIPSPQPYLSSQPDKVTAWQQRLGPKTKPRVGLVWSGNPTFPGDQARSLLLADVWPHLPPEFDYVCLQKVVRDVDQDLLQSSSMRQFCDEIHDFTDTAALCQLMDVVVSSCTSVAHLAAAIGRPTWILLPYAPDWRWLLNREDSPWYESVKLYRQGADGRWDSVLSRVSVDLQAHNSQTHHAQRKNNRPHHMPPPRAKTTHSTTLAQALARHQSGAVREALQMYQRLLRQQPKDAQLLYLMGAAYLQLEQFELGRAKTQASLAIDSHNAAAWNNLGYALKSLGHLSQAVAHYDQAIAIAPDQLDAHYNRGIACQSLCQFEAALASHDNVIALNPQHAKAYFGRALALEHLSRWQEAIDSYDQAIAINAHYVDAHSNKGLMLMRLARLEEAVDSFDRAIAIDPRHTKSHNNKGLALKNLLRVNEALVCFDQALAIDPDYADAHCNRANLLKECQRLDEALLSFDKAMALKPEDAEVRWNTSLALLLKGDCVKGWPLYESRWARENVKPFTRNFTQALWLGTQSLEGKTVLLHAEQGLGDSIQFCRYAKRVRDLGATVLLEAPQALMGLFESLEGVSQLIEAGTPLPDFDYHCPLLSLPLAFKTDLSNIPSPQPYLSSQAAKVATWQQRLGPKTKPRVGLVWSGNPTFSGDHMRSLLLADVWPHLPPEFDYVCLQKVVRDVDQDLLQSSGMRQYCDEIQDFTDTAALCELMDVVVSSCTSVAHLAAAIGRPTWIMLPYAADWRWLLNREDSPWYEGVKLYRQEADRRWDSVVSRIAADLRHKMRVAPNPVDRLSTPPHHEPRFETELAKAVALHQSGNVRDALQAYEHLLRTQPAHAQLLYLMGAAYAQLGQFEAGAEKTQASLALNPHNAAAWNNLGYALKMLGQPHQALTHYAQATALSPHYLDAYYNQGLAHQDLQQFEAALSSFDKVIELTPRHALAYLGRGIALKNLSRCEEAIDSYNEVIAIDPNSADAHYNKGLALDALKRVEEAMASYDSAIAIQADYVNAHYNKGILLAQLKRFHQALTCYDTAIAYKPDHAESHLNRGNLLDTLNRFEEALQSYDQALIHNPSASSTYMNRGNLLLRLRRTQEAFASYDQAIALDPDNAIPRWNKSFALLRSGDWLNGWPLYESRWGRQDTPISHRHFTQTLWLGEVSLEGKTVLLYPEQGFGDSIQFCRYAKRVRDLGATVLLEAPPALMGLFQSLEGVSQLIETGKPLPDFDYHCPLLSLPLAFKTTPNNIPSPGPYLSSQPAKVAAWHQRLGPQTKPRVGLVWSGNPEFTGDHSRSMTLADVWSHLPPEFEYICLQKVVRDVDQALLRSSGIRHFCDELHDFTDTAALCELMDVVVSSCTSMAHLSAAIGRPTWIMLSYAPDWRWLLDREDSPWYESVKLYRQEADWRWDTVIQRIATDLRATL